MLFILDSFGLPSSRSVIDDLASATSAPLKAIRVLAQFLKADHANNEAGKATAVSNAKDMLKAAESSVPPLSPLSAASLSLFHLLGL